MAVTESGGAANAFFNSELSHQLITAGNATADQLHVRCCVFVSTEAVLTRVIGSFHDDRRVDEPEIGGVRAVLQGRVGQAR